MASTLTDAEFEYISANQCPLPPQRYSYNGKKLNQRVAAWFYKDEFWFQDPDTKEIRMADMKQRDKQRYAQRVQEIRAVDDYLKEFRLNASVQIYQRLKEAVQLDAQESAQSVGQRQASLTSLIDAEKFSPTWWHRLGFWTLIGRAMLNAYFIITNFIFLDEVPSNLWIFVLIVVCIEAVIWLMAFTRFMWNLRSLVTRMCTSDTTHYQVKNIPENLSQLASISVMRYLPNGEAISLFKKRAKEWVDEKRADFTFQKDHAKFKCFVVIRWIILTILDVIGPFVAVFSLFFKMAQLNFHFDVILQWQWNQIISYFAFVNQVAGIRKVREIEIDALEHFIFSGHDAILSQEERMLLNCWWNSTIVSCVANICDAFRYPVYDSMVFWYILDINRIQLLFKDHQAVAVDITNAGNVSSFKKEYNQDMRQKMDQHLTSNRVIETLPTDSAMDEADLETAAHDNHDVDEEENEEKEKED